MDKNRFIFYFKSNKQKKVVRDNIYFRFNLISYFENKKIYVLKIWKFLFRNNFLLKNVELYENIWNLKFLLSGFNIK